MKNKQTWEEKTFLLRRIRSRKVIMKKVVVVVVVVVVAFLFLALSLFLE
jgi:hypothetical protein